METILMSFSMPLVAKVISLAVVVPRQQLCWISCRSGTDVTHASVLTYSTRTLAENGIQHVSDELNYVK